MRHAVLLGSILVGLMAGSVGMAESASGGSAVAGTDGSPAATAVEGAPATIAATREPTEVAASADPIADTEASPAAQADATTSEGPADGSESSTIASRSPREWYEMGGGTMHALSLCSALILGLIIERALALRRGRFVPRKLDEALGNAIEIGHRQEIKSLCESDRSALARLCRIALEGSSARHRLQAEGAAAAHQTQRNLPMLAALGNLATMLGLLGTVIGMVEAFQVIAQSGTGDARIVASGIFRALVTTAAGLGLGILALAAHALFARKAADLVVLLETRVTTVAEEVDRPNPAWSGERDSLELS
jgi:biopolymer transport protein ExbB